MHEINTAAEAITTAADPDANIIFGATINPELEGEVIITVVATGFDASYFAKRTGKAAGSAAVASEPKLDNAHTGITKQDEKNLSEIDMNLDDDHAELRMTSPATTRCPTSGPSTTTMTTRSTDDSCRRQSKHDDDSHARLTTQSSPVT